MKMVLEGIRVVDFTQMHAGPYGTAMLADLGAEVIHVEHPVRGDGMRGVANSFGVALELPNGRHLCFEDLNRNKKGITLDVAKPEGKEIMYRLIRESDVFASNIRGLDRLGLDYETLRQQNPKLIYASVTGFGGNGPDKDLPALELAVYARSGIMVASAGLDQPPVNPTLGIGDRLAAIFLGYGLVTALLARERLGIGQKVDLSLLGSLVVTQGYSVLPPLVLGREYARITRTGARNPTYNWYLCKDEKWIALGSPMDVHWLAVCRAIGRPDLATDPRYDDLLKREERREELIELLDNVFATKTSEEWASLLRQVDMIFSVVNSIPDLTSDPQVLENKYITEWDHPDLGPMKWVGFPVEFSETPASFRSAAPQFGQHTDEILTQVLGYSWDDIIGFRERGVI